MSASRPLAVMQQGRNEVECALTEGHRILP